MPLKAFDCTDKGRRAVALYYVSTPLKTGSLAALTSIKVVVKQYHIICEKDEILNRGARLELAAKMHGKVVRLEMLVDGKEDKGVHFQVRDY